MDQSRPRTVVRLTVYRNFESWRTAQSRLRPVLTGLQLTVYWNFESWRTAQNRLRPVLTGLFTPKASQVYAMVFINFKSNFTAFFGIVPTTNGVLDGYFWSITCQSPTTTSSAQRHADRHLPHAHDDLGRVGLVGEWVWFTHSPK